MIKSHTNPYIFVIEGSCYEPEQQENLIYGREPGSPNPDPISDQITPFSIPVFKLEL